MEYKRFQSYIHAYTQTHLYIRMQDDNNYNDTDAKCYSSNCYYYYHRDYLYYFNFYYYYYYYYSRMYIYNGLNMLYFLYMHRKNDNFTSELH